MTLQTKDGAEKFCYYLNLFPFLFVACFGKRIGFSFVSLATHVTLGSLPGFLYVGFVSDRNAESFHRINDLVFAVLKSTILVSFP